MDPFHLRHSTTHAPEPAPGLTVEPNPSDAGKTWAESQTRKARDRAALTALDPREAQVRVSSLPPDGGEWRRQDWQIAFAYTPENLPLIKGLIAAQLALSPEQRATTAWEKGMSRLEDAQRIAAGEATPAQVQAENSFLPAEVIRSARMDFDPARLQACAEGLLLRLQEFDWELADGGADPSF